MRFGVTTWAVKDAPMARKLSAFRELGFDTVSFLYRVYPSDAQGEEAQLASLVVKHDLFVTVHGAIGDCSQTTERVRVLADIHSVAEWQQESQRVLAMTFDPGFTKDNNGVMHFALEGTIDLLRQALETLAPLGIRVGLENWQINTDLACFDAVAEQLAHPGLGILLDLGHLNISWRSGQLGDLSIAEYIQRLPLPIWELHVHDNNGREDQHLPLGQGNLDANVMATALMTRDFDGIVTVEVGASFNEAGKIASIRATRGQIADALQAAKASEHAGR